jgi:hypothetical protein
MFCMKCNHELSECTCPDLQERLGKIASSGNFMYRACKKCGNHYAKCKCEEPEWIVVGGGDSTKTDLERRELRKKRMKVIKS